MRRQRMAKRTSPNVGEQPIPTGTGENDRDMSMTSSDLLGESGAFYRIAHVSVLGRVGVTESVARLSSILLYAEAPRERGKETFDASNLRAWSELSSRVNKVELVRGEEWVVSREARTTGIVHRRTSETVSISNAKRSVGPIVLGFGADASLADEWAGALRATTQPWERLLEACVGARLFDVEVQVAGDREDDENADVDTSAAKQASRRTRMANTATTVTNNRVTRTVATTAYQAASSVATSRAQKLATRTATSAMLKSTPVSLLYSFPVRKAGGVLVRRVGGSAVQSTAHNQFSSVHVRLLRLLNAYISEAVRVVAAGADAIARGESHRTDLVRARALITDLCSIEDTMRRFETRAAEQHSIAGTAVVAPTMVAVATRMCARLEAASFLSEEEHGDDAAATSEDMEGGAEDNADGGPDAEAGINAEKQKEGTTGGGGWRGQVSRRLRKDRPPADAESPDVESATDTKADVEEPANSAAQDHGKADEQMGS